MMPFFYALAILLVSVNMILALPKAVSLAESRIFANNIFLSGSIDPKPEVAGIEKINLPPQSKGQPMNDLTALAVLVKDADNDFIYYVKNSDRSVPIASATKIMTALLAVESYQPEDVLTVLPEALVSGSNMGLHLGEKLTLRSLLYGLLLNSGNDAAFAIAANYPEGVWGFVEEMNKKAKEIGLAKTHFDNPAGFDSPNHYSSASDLAKIAILAANNSEIARIIATKEITVYSTDQRIVHPLKNLNKMLIVPGALGIKTGTTPAAKENLVGLFMRHNRRILTVVLGSEDRFTETQTILDWLDSNFTWEDQGQVQSQ